MRWLVERASGADNFEDVGAEMCKIEDGCLVFRDSIWDPPILFIAAGQWKTVCQAAE